LVGFIWQRKIKSAKTSNMSYSRKVGELETKLLQLGAPPDSHELNHSEEKLHDDIENEAATS
jgi:hypothetical protein